MPSAVTLGRFAGAVLAVAGLLGAAPPPPGAARFASDVKRITGRAQFAAAHFGIAVYDLDTERVVYQHDGNKLFVAASTTKLLTEGTTLQLFGPKLQFTTNVYASAPVAADGTLPGNLVLRAVGDPNLSQRIRPDGTLAFVDEDHSYGGAPVPGDPLVVLRDFARQIALHGVRRVTGRVIVDDSLFPDTTAEGGTGETIAPIELNDNIVDLTVTPGKSAGDPATLDVSPQTPYVTFTNKIVTGKLNSRVSIDQPSDVEDAVGNRNVVLTGSIAAGGAPQHYPYAVPTPARFAEVALTQALLDAGIIIAPPPKDMPLEKKTLAALYVPANVVAKHESPPISEDIRITLKVSDNLHAATMPYVWGAFAGKDPSDPLTAGFKLESAIMKDAGFNPLDIVLNDGAGVGAFIRPLFMVHWLAHMTHSQYFNFYYRGLPVLGVDGTLAEIQKHAPAAGKVHAKTGTDGVADVLNDRSPLVTGKGLAGYVTTVRGRHLAFCFYLNNLVLPPGSKPSAATVAGQALGELANAAYLDF